MRLSHVRFEGEIRFPGVARNSTTFGESEGYVIELDADFRAVTVSAGVRAVVVPWTRVLEAVPWSSPEPAPQEPAPTLTSDEPTPVPRARRGRRQAPPSE